MVGEVSVLIVPFMELKLIGSTIQSSYGTVLIVPFMELKHSESESRSSSSEVLIVPFMELKLRMVNEVASGYMS